ncbi:hypothetical protein PR003_g31462 [Phytophthora rubi]|uniref:Uncharacterized protein n=1 Tax=Phytophthora rubi TaxID=129364 RepID=A0A6A4B821_9STRA|nr:hypothetical protein PF003_g20343 [Phytophthora fragariae]KAE9268394.1 hypothetical protein PR003_g31462 [Phytophthora rubi]
MIFPVAQLLHLDDHGAEPAGASLFEQVQVGGERLGLRARATHWKSFLSRFSMVKACW